MSLQTVPLQVTPNQSFSLVLNELDVGITLRTLQGALYADVVCQGVPICTGQLCLDRVPVTMRAAYLGFPDLSLVFADLRGTSDPEWRGFGTRYVLLNVAGGVDLSSSATTRNATTGLFYDGAATYDGSQTYDGIAA